HDAGRANEIVCTQVDGSLPDTVENIVVAYEPVWAIGTGSTATPDDVRTMHALIRERLLARFGPTAEAVRILYGGSVKPGNAKELLGIENVDGALVGGASLNAGEFLAIAEVYR
ncbi:MAG TPA: triose-phosphate isomerase, partial [Xanthobacteraceae bacterium]